MLRYIWNSWQRNKSRLLLLLIGVLIISSGLSFLVGLDESSKTKVDSTINGWKPSYHILVRAQGTRSITEEDGLLDPNYITGLNGGVSLEQWNKIKEITNVEVAAPLANIGYAIFWAEFGKNDIDLKTLEDGIYKVSYKTSSQNGKKNEKILEAIQYSFIGKWKFPASNRSASYNHFINKKIGLDSYLIAGIDPSEEAKLVGNIHEAANANGRYFNKYDSIKVDTFDETLIKYVFAPVLSSDQLFTNQEYSMTIEKVESPTLKKQIEKIQTSSNRFIYIDNLDNLELDTLFNYQFNAGDDTKYYKNPQLITNKNKIFYHGKVTMLPSVVDYKKRDSLYKENWPYAYSATAYGDQNNYLNENYYFYYKQNYNSTYKQFKKIQQDMKLFIFPKFIGAYKTNKLMVEKEPIMNLPLDIYRPATGKLVLDAEGKPLNPPVTIKQNSNPFGFINNSPHLLTTIEAASEILGEKPISAIRVKVKDVEGISEENRQKIKQVAEEIEQQTGLMTDIIYGASPQPVLVYVPKNGDTPALGWVEEVWIKLGNTTTIFNEFATSYTGTFYSIFLVPLIYIIATFFIFYLTRKKEFALLLATGWKTKSLIQMIFIESGLIGLMMTFTAWGILGIVSMQQDMILSLPRFLLIGLLAFLIAITGSILPSIIVSRITPYQAMKTGEISKRKTKLFSSKHAFTMAITGFFSRIQRNILSFLSIAIPTMLLIYYLFISDRLEGILYTSWLGKYVAMEVGPIHYITIIVALVLSILTTAQIMLQNVEERKSELALLKALGWRNSTIRKLIISEGFFLGVFSAITGLIFGLLMIVNIYKQLPTKNITIYLAAGMIPLLVGTIGAIIPAEKAARQAPLKGISGSYTINKATSKFFNYSLAVLGVAIFITASISTTQVVRNSIMLSKQVEATIHEEQQAKAEEEAQRKALEKKRKNIGIMDGFVPKGVPNYSKGKYNIDFTMSEKGTFQVNAKIKVQNLSEDTWNKIVFYFIPNVFTKESREKLEKFGELAKLEEYIKSIEVADVEIREVKVDGKIATYNLNYDTLAVNNTIQPKEIKAIEVTYSFTVPERGIRLNKEDDNYYLAQWYPMLATYRDGKWNKEDYLPVSESYHTDYSDYTVTYHIPDGYSLVSSAEKDANANHIKGELKATKIKDFFIHIFRDKGLENKNGIESREIDGIEVRVSGGDLEKRKRALELATEVVKYFDVEIGPYPYKQLDVVLGGGANMEYSGIVTVSEPENKFAEVISHEIGHQWLYGVVSNDPYHDGWIDEGLTALSTGVFLFDNQKKNFEESFQLAEREQRVTGSENAPYSNLTIKKFQTGFVVNLYDRPLVRLWALFEDYGGMETIGPFLKEYYNQYAFKEVDTKEFVRFTKAYFHLSDNKYFEDWLKLD